MSDPQTPTADTLRLDRVAKDRARLRAVIVKLRTQVKNPAMLDAFLSGNLSPVTAIDGRLPFTPVKVITIPNKTMCLHNILGWAVLKWGFLARNEDGNPGHLNPELELLERIADTKGGFKVWGAYPKDRNSAIHVLRTAVEEKKIREDRAAAQEKALEQKLKIRDIAAAKAEDQEPPAPKTGLEQEEPDGEDVPQVVEGGGAAVGGAAPGSPPDGAVVSEAGENPGSPDA